MDGPAMGPPPNFGMPIDFSSRVPQILIGVITPFVIASIFVAGRLYARAIIVRSWGWDDTFVTISWTLALGVATIACLSTKFGSGHHADAIDPSSAVPALKLRYANLLLYQASLTTTKFSICLFHLRLFSDRKSRYLIFGTMVWIICYFMPCEIIDMFQCDPVSGIWNRRITSKCIDNTPCFYTSAVCNIVGDAWLIILIAPRIWPLKMARRQKIALMSVITSGWLVIVAAIVRVVRISKSMDSEDRAWTYYDTAIWSGLEIAVGLFCVSAPAIKPVLQKYMPNLVSSFSPSESYIFPDNHFNHNYTKSNSGAPHGTVTYVNCGASEHAAQADTSLELHELNGKPKSGDVGVKKSNSRTGNRAFWWDKNPGSNADSDSESTEEIVSKSELPAGFESTPATGIMKSTSVTVSVEESKPSQEVQRSRSTSNRRNSRIDRGVGSLSFDHSERGNRRKEG